MSDSEMGRRCLFLALIPAGLLALGCDETEQFCPVPEGDDLNFDQRKIRERVAYEHRDAPIEKACRVCSYFVPGKGCGTCSVVPGPIAPGATCRLFQNAS